MYQEGEKTTIQHILWENQNTSRLGAQCTDVLLVHPANALQHAFNLSRLLI